MVLVLIPLSNFIRKAKKYLVEFDEGDKDPRAALPREPAPPEAGLRWRAEEERSEGGSPKPLVSNKIIVSLQINYIEHKLY